VLLSVFFFYYRHPTGYKVECLCSKLNFKWRQTFFHVLIGHLCIFCGKMFIKMLCS
jgi:hypothetical protein